jgi:hypothetical protein
LEYLERRKSGQPTSIMAECRLMVKESSNLGVMNMQN